MLMHTTTLTHMPIMKHMRLQTTNTSQHTPTKPMIHTRMPTLMPTVRKTKATAIATPATPTLTLRMHTLTPTAPTMLIATRRITARMPMLTATIATSTPTPTLTLRDTATMSPATVATMHLPQMTTSTAQRKPTLRKMPTTRATTTLALRTATATLLSLSCT